MRMDRYNDEDTKENENEASILSRVDKNQKIYDDIYMNNSYVSIDDILKNQNEEKEEDTKPKEVITYEEKNYDINDYLLKARERFKPDDEKRNLDEDFLKDEDEISKLISSIDEKNEEEDFFSELKSENADTMIDGQLTEEEILETTSYEEYTFDTTTNTIQLSKVLGNETIVNLKLEEAKNNEGFADIEQKGLSKKKKRNIAIIFFVISLLLLISVIILVVLPKI